MTLKDTNNEELKIITEQTSEAIQKCVMFYEKSIELIIFLLQTVKFNKQQKEQIESKLSELNGMLARISGEPYKITLEQQQELKRHLGEFSYAIDVS